MELNEAKKLIDVWNSVESELENIFIDELLEAQALVTEDRVRKECAEIVEKLKNAHKHTGYCEVFANDIEKAQKQILSPKQA